MVPGYDLNDLDDISLEDQVVHEIGEYINANTIVSNITPNDNIISSLLLKLSNKFEFHIYVLHDQRPFKVSNH